MRAAAIDRPSRTERIKELTDRLEQGVKDLFESDRYAAYVAGWSRGRELEELKQSLERVHSTAAELIDSIESRCPALFPKVEKQERQKKHRSQER